MEPISGIIFGIICAIVADSRGRSAIGWFFIGLFLSCFGLILLLVLPDLTVMERRDSHLQAENRRLREKIRRDRILADDRHSETLRRLDAHDQVLQIDTATPPALNRNDEVGLIGGEGGDTGYAEAAWWWAEEENQHGPITFGELQQLWREDGISEETLVWCELFQDWEKIAEVWDLEEELNA